MFCLAIDGDSIRCDGEEIRLLGVNTPEVHGPCRTEALVASRFTARRLREARVITLERWGVDRYGRTLAVVRVDGEVLAELLIGAGVGVRYGDTRRRTRVGEREPDRC